ncbi:hypothetical protein BaRGS_00039205 [Batillaria attramentaria]|uniref:Synaptosomal-associated protein 47 n=1 Tax=Batillaria attramentaria TaxID=370345 RepID=A0ABD0J3X5_9CAEN
MSCDIRTWKVSYYSNDKRRWITGQLTCSAFDVSFVSAHKTDQPKHDQTDTDTCVTENQDPAAEPVPLVRIQYSDIRQVQKASSMLIYAAVTIETRDGAVHWFSSLPDRYSVYNMLHHFARQNLTGEASAQASVVDPAARTRIGQQLLRSAEDSERTLAGAASSLWHQGRQLANASVMVQEMHEDLDVADRLLSGLNSYLGRWRLPPEYNHAEPVLVGKGDIPTDQDYEVLCSVMSKNQWHPQQLCTLRTAQPGLTLLDVRQQLLHSLRWVELSRVFVVSPWEVVLTKHVAGKADVSVSVVSAALLPVLQLVQMRVPHLIDYQAPPEGSQGATSTGRSSESATERQQAGEQQTSPGHKSFGSPNKSPSKTKEVDSAEKCFASDIDEFSTQASLQCQKQEEVSDAELRALSNRLGGLKMLATAVGEEVTNQNKSLDELTATVDHADSRIRDCTRRMKKLM